MAIAHFGFINQNGQTKPGAAAKMAPTNSAADAVCCNGLPSGISTHDVITSQKLAQRPRPNRKSTQRWMKGYFNTLAGRSIEFSFPMLIDGAMRTFRGHLRLLKLSLGLCDRTTGTFFKAAKNLLEGAARHDPFFSQYGQTVNHYAMAFR